MAGVGGDGVPLVALTVQAESDVGASRHPERVVERLSEGRGAVPCFGGEGRLPPSPRQGGGRSQGGVGVALGLHDGHGQGDGQVVPLPVLPALMEQGLGVVLRVHEEPPVPEPAVVHHPAVGRDDGPLKLPDKAEVLRPAPILLQDHEEEGGAVHAPVVRKLPPGQLGLGRGVRPVLVEDLARLLLRGRVDALPLEPRQLPERGRRDRRVDIEGLPGGDQRVAAEEGVVARMARPQVPVRGPEPVHVRAQPGPHGVQVHDTSRGRRPAYVRASPVFRSNRWIRRVGNRIHTFCRPSTSKFGLTTTFTSWSPTFRSRIMMSPWGSVV